MKMLVALVLSLVASAAYSESYDCLSVDQDVQIKVVAFTSVDISNPTRRPPHQGLIRFEVAAGNLSFAETTATALVWPTAETANKHLAGTTIADLASIVITFDPHYRELSRGDKPKIAAQAAYLRRDSRQLVQDFTCSVEP